MNDRRAVMARPWCAIWITRVPRILETSPSEVWNFVMDFGVPPLCRPVIRIPECKESVFLCKNGFLNQNCSNLTITCQRIEFREFGKLGYFSIRRDLKNFPSCWTLHIRAKTKKVLRHNWIIFELPLRGRSLKFFATIESCSWARFSLKFL